MEERRILSKCYILLYLETIIKPRQSDSRELVKELLDNDKMIQRLVGPGVHNMDGTGLLIKTVYDMCNDPPDIEYSREDILADIEFITMGHKDALYSTLRSAIQDSSVMTPEAVTKRIITIKRELNEKIRRQRLINVVSRAYGELAEGGKPLKTTISTLIGEIEGEISSGEEDPAIIDKVNLDDPNTLEEIYKRAREEHDGTAILKTGWEVLNKTLQGGFRRGEFVTLAALQHNYKTGMGLSLFAQIAMCNKPSMINEDRKPLLLRISLEDELHHNFSMLFTYLKYAETRENVDPYQYDYKEMTSYVKEQLEINGYHIKMLRVNPSEWTYRNLLDVILNYEAEGYEVHMCMVDYLSMLPTYGCDRSGAAGTDVQDMFKRVRNFFSSKKICFITPHQLSTEAKQLWREGIRGRKLLEEINGGGYYAKSRQLDTEIDLELYIALEEDKRVGKTYLHMCRGKHRGTGIIPTKDKYLVFEFPESMPIPPDTEEIKQGARTVQELKTGVSDSDDF